MRFDIAIVNYNTDFYLLNLLRSIRGALPSGSFDACHVWDNGSSDASRAVLEALGGEFDWLRAHISASNVHHGPALDRLLRDHCRAEWVLVLDSDTWVRHDFREALPKLDGERPAFIGQVHPELRQLYSYLCHLLVNRAWYLDLPPFDRDGAPGRAFFRGVADRGLHWRRFRWSDHVEHYGQGTLHGVLQRGETSNPLYGYAAEQSRSNRSWHPAIAHERRLRQELARFLAERGIPGTPGALEPVATEAPGAPVASGLPPGRPTVRVRRRARWDWLPFPASRVIRIAERFGLAQRASELARLFRLVRRRRPRTVLELGRAGGGTFFLWTRAASSRAVLVSVGLLPWEHDDPNGEARWEAKATLGRPRQRLHVLADDPLRASVRARVESLLGDRRLDFLFLTGEDDVDRVRDCLDLYVPLMRPGGLVALDGVRQRLGGTDRMPAFWRQVRRRARSRDLVEDESRPGFGIGVVWIGPRASPTWWRD